MGCKTSSSTFPEAISPMKVPQVSSNQANSINKLESQSKQATEEPKSQAITKSVNPEEDVSIRRSPIVKNEAKEDESIRRSPIAINQSQEEQSMKRTPIAQDTKESTKNTNIKKTFKKEVTVRIKEDGNPDVPGQKLLNILGKGSFGTTQKAICEFEQELTNQTQYAIKIVECKKLSPSEKQETMNEAKSLFSISQKETPNSLVKFHHALYLNEVLMIIMEFCPNGTLENEIKKRSEENKHFKEEELKSISTQLLTGLAFIHDLKMIHRDIKPANIFFNNEMVPKIGDFGIVKKQDEKGSQENIGTPKQMAPEILEGSQNQDNKVDVWSLGIVFLEMSCFASSMGKIMKGDFDDVAKLYPEEWVEVISKMLDLDPKNRLAVKDLLKLPFFTEEIANSSKRPKTVWVTEIEIKNRIPERNLFAAGKEADGNLLQIAKVTVGMGEYIGKKQLPWENANIPLNGKEVCLPNFSIFLGLSDKSKPVWVRATLGNIPKNAIPMGKTENGEYLYSARAIVCGGMHPGVISRGKKYAEIPYGGIADQKAEYEVLCYPEAHK